MRKGLVILLVLTAFFLSGDLFGQGCSQCKLLAEQGSELDEASFGSNINYGILYLMIIPYLLIMFLFRERIFAFFKKLFGKNPT
jgi:hypothetical protein